MRCIQFQGWFSLFFEELHKETFMLGAPKKFALSTFRVILWLSDQRNVALKSYQSWREMMVRSRKGSPTVFSQQVKKLAHSSKKLFRFSCRPFPKCLIFFCKRWHCGCFLLAHNTTEADLREWHIISPPLTRPTLQDFKTQLLIFFYNFVKCIYDLTIAYGAIAYIARL